MTWVGFRPSDDESAQFNIPVNALVAVAMRKMAELCRYVYGDAVLATLADRLASEIEEGIAKHGTTSVTGEQGELETIYAYETDGKGNITILDDANTPSLLSLPYFGFGNASTRSLYNSTRRWVLSRANPLFKQGACAAGVGSNHTKGNRVWPMSLIAQAITSDDDTEVGRLLQMLLNSDCGTGYMHESFEVDNGCKYTRPFFGWPNSFFAELIDKLQATGRLTPAMLALPRLQCG